MPMSKMKVNAARLTVLFSLRIPPDFGRDAVTKKADTSAFLQKSSAFQRFWRMPGENFIPSRNDNMGPPHLSIYMLVYPANPRIFPGCNTRELFSL